MLVRDVMSKNCCIIGAGETLKHAARVMANEDIGALPVYEEDRLVGMITDRDITVRCVAEGKDCSARVREAMTPQIKYCFEDDNLDEVLDNMSELQLRRLPVMSRNKRLVGIITLADAARRYSPDAAGIAYSGVAEPQNLAH